MRRMIKYTIEAWCVVAIVALASGVVIAYTRSNPPIHVPDANRERFADIIVLIDGTESMKGLYLSQAKQILIARYLPSIGVGDKLACYSVGPRFGPENLVCGGTLEHQPPQFTPSRRTAVMELLQEVRTTSTPGRLRTPFYKLAGELAEQEPQLSAIRSRWTQEIEAMKRPEQRGTNLRCAIESIDAYFLATRDPQVERIVIVLSDLIDDPRLGRPCTGRPDKETPPLTGARVILLHPQDSSRDWNAVAAKWRRYFGDRHIDVAPFSTELNQSALLLPNPVEGLSDQATPTFTEHFVSLARAGARSMFFGFVFSAVFGSGLAAGLDRAANRRQ